LSERRAEIAEANLELALRSSQIWCHEAQRAMARAEVAEAAVARVRELLECPDGFDECSACLSDIREALDGPPAKPGEPEYATPPCPDDDGAITPADVSPGGLWHRVAGFMWDHDE
jgi:hypothetical protein